MTNENDADNKSITKFEFNIQLTIDWEILINLFILLFKSYLFT